MILIQAIYLPSLHQYERWLTSYNSYKHSTLTKYIGGYISEEVSSPFREELVEEVCLDLLPDNRGKSTVFNRIVSTLTESDDTVVILLDGDIILSLLDLENLDSLYHSHNYQVLVPNQLEDCRHHPYALKNNGLTTFGIAGGCMITTLKTLKRYPFSVVGMYGPEDVLFLEAVKSVFIIDECVIHPHDDDQEYKDKKLKELKNTVY